MTGLFATTHRGFKMNPRQHIITNAYSERDTISPLTASTELMDALQTTLDDLNRGSLRVAEKINGQWVTHSWLKHAISLWFLTQRNQVMPGFSPGFDKIPLKFNSYNSFSFCSHRNDPLVD